MPFPQLVVVSWRVCGGCIHTRRFPPSEMGSDNLWAAQDAVGPIRRGQDRLLGKDEPSFEA